MCVRILPGVSALGAERRFSPGLALSDQWAVDALFPSQAAELLRPSAPQLPPPLNDIQRPLIAATYFDFQQLGEAVQQWVDCSQPMIESALHQAPSPANDADDAVAADDAHDAGPLSDLSPAETLELGKMLLRALQSVQSYSRASYTQDNTVVTQYLS